MGGIALPSCADSLAASLKPIRGLIAGSLELRRVMCRSSEIADGHGRADATPGAVSSTTRYLPPPRSRYITLSRGQKKRQYRKQKQKEEKVEQSGEGCREAAAD